MEMIELLDLVTEETGWVTSLLELESYRKPSSVIAYLNLILRPTLQLRASKKVRFTLVRVRKTPGGEDRPAHTAPVSHRFASKGGRKGAAMIATLRNGRTRLRDIAL
jgi:hypothetical protein